MPTLFRTLLTHCTVCALLSLQACNGTEMSQRHADIIKDAKNITLAAATHDAKLANQVTASLPEVVSQALSASPTQTKQHHWRRFNLSVNKMPAKQFFSYLASLDNVNMVVSPDITGVITLNLKQITLPEVLHALTDSYGFRIENKDFGFKVMQERLLTRIYTIDWLSMTRSGKSSMNINDLQHSRDNDSTSSSSSNTTGSSSSSEASSSSEITTTFGIEDYWQEITTAIENIIRPDGEDASNKKSMHGRSVTVNKANGLVVVRASRRKQKLVEAYLRSLHAINSKQVVIDARFIEVNMTQKQEFGLRRLGLPYFDWSNNSSSSAAGYNKTSSTTSTTSFSAILDTLSSVGKVALLSSPRVSTLNNQKALIKVGDDQYFSMGTTTSFIESGSLNTTPTVSNNLQSFFSGIALDVTPQVDLNDNITLHIHPIISSITPVVTTSGNNESLELPKTSIRETDTIVRARSGQIIVIGGLISDKSMLQRNKVPGMERHAWNSHRSDSYDKVELFILLRPTIIDDKGWVTELDKTRHQLSGRNDF